MAHHALHCRGSLETSDILSDLIAQPLEIFGLLDTEGLVHEGMMAAATYATHLPLKHSCPFHCMLARYAHI